MSDLEKTLAGLPKLFREREEALGERETKLRRLQKSLEKKHPNLGKPSDVIRLNIGGKRVDVLRRTLTQVEGSLLESMFSGRWNDSLEKDDDGNYFLDQDETFFVPLLNFLRAKQNETPITQKTAPPCFTDDGYSDIKKMSCFQTMCEYYGLTHFVFPTGVYTFDFEDLAATRLETWKLVGECRGDCEMKSDELETYWLKPISHERMVVSYEIILGDCTLAQIGWFRVGVAMSTFAPFPNPPSNPPQAHKGVGYGNGSQALDCFRGGTLCNNTFKLLGSGSVSLKSGTTIRTEKSSEEGVKWYVDGTLVATERVSNNSQHPKYHDMKDHGIPCISVAGSFSISKIELQF